MTIGMQALIHPDSFCEDAEADASSDDGASGVDDSAVPSHWGRVRSISCLSCSKIRDQHRTQTAADSCCMALTSLLRSPATSCLPCMDTSRIWTRLSARHYAPPTNLRAQCSTAPRTRPQAHQGNTRNPMHELGSCCARLQTPHGMSLTCGHAACEQRQHSEPAVHGRHFHGPASTARPRAVGGELRRLIRALGRRKGTRALAEEQHQQP